MESHFIELPRRVVVGRNVIEDLPTVLAGFDVKKPLVLSGEKTAVIAGNRVADILKADLKKVEGASPDEIKKFEKIKMDAVVGVGGGKVIDVGKMLAFVKGVPFISVPTSPSHDGIASDRVSLKDGEMAHSIKTVPPAAIVADIDIIEKAPYRLIAAGCGDIISNYTAVADWILGRAKGEYYSQYAATLSLLASEIVMKSAELIKKGEERGIRNLMEAIVTSGIAMSIAGSSRPASGAEHMFSHALDSLGSGALHGEQCGIGSIIFACLQGGEWEKIKKSLEKIGAPTKFTQLGIRQNMVIEALLKAKDVRDRYTILNEKPFTQETAERLCKFVGVF